MIDGHYILDLPIDSVDTDSATIREYFCDLAYQLWRDGEGFSGKRPFGNSGWQYAIETALEAIGLNSEDPEVLNDAFAVLSEPCICEPDEWVGRISSHRDLNAATGAIYSENVCGLRRHQEIVKERVRRVTKLEPVFIGREK